jgi:hypothetical protein
MLRGKASSAFSTGIVCYLALRAGKILFETRATEGRPGFELFKQTSLKMH